MKSKEQILDEHIAASFKLECKNGVKMIYSAMEEYAKQEAGKSDMKWVKASERLPENNDQLVCMRGDGGGCYHYETADRSMLIKALKEDEGVHHKFEPEWLDERVP